MTIRPLKGVDDPLGSYLRVTKRDTQFLVQMLVDGRDVGTGLVADPALTSDQRDLWIEAHSHGVETVLDSRALDLSTPGGFERFGARALPWAHPTPHRPADLTEMGGRRMVEHIADAVADINHTAVLAPAHMVGDTPDEWLDVDAALTYALRKALNERDLTNVLIYYPLIARGEQFYDPQWRASIIARALPPSDRRRVAAHSPLRNQQVWTTGSQTLSACVPRSPHPERPAGRRAHRGHWCRARGFRRHWRC